MNESLIFRKKTFLMVLILGICFLFPLTSHASRDIEVPVELNLSKTGEQDLPDDWSFFIKLREIDGSKIDGNDIFEEVVWDISQGTTINRNPHLEMGSLSGWEVVEPHVRWRTTYVLSR